MCVCVVGMFFTIISVMSNGGTVDYQPVPYDIF